MDLHRTSKDSHSIMKSTSSSSSGSSSSNNNSNSSTGSVHHQHQHQHQHHHPQRAAKRQIPVIRVVHIFNPTVIKTDVANFRSLVQELTGSKPRTSDAKKSSNQARKQSSVYDGHLKQLQSTPKEFISNKPHMLGIIADESHQIIRNPTATIKPTPMYIPERLGTFSDLGEMVSSLQDPLMEFSDLLPSLGGVGADDDGPHAALSRFASLYESL